LALSVMVIPPKFHLYGLCVRAPLLASSGLSRAQSGNAVKGDNWIQGTLRMDAFACLKIFGTAGKRDCLIADGSYSPIGLQRQSTARTASDTLVSPVCLWRVERP
jgi:hypothetical protein